jgi:hypothetical protein
MTDRDKIECFAGRIENENEECLDAVEANFDFHCDTIIRDFLSDHFDNRQDTVCVLDKLKSQENYRTKILLLSVLEYAKVSWKIWKYFERNARLIEVKLELETIEKHAGEICAGIETTSQRADPTISVKEKTTTTERPIETSEMDEIVGSGDDDEETTLNPITHKPEQNNKSVTQASPNSLLSENGSGNGNYVDNYDEYDDEDSNKEKKVDDNLKDADEDFSFS